MPASGVAGAAIACQRLDGVKLRRVTMASSVQRRHQRRSPLSQTWTLTTNQTNLRFRPRLARSRPHAASTLASTIGSGSIDAGSRRESSEYRPQY
jgi:hypothetical protein